VADELKMAAVDGYNGSAFVPTGDPMVDGVGPAAWADRADVPDMTAHGKPKIVPMRVATDFTIAEGDPDPRGLPVKGCDGVVAGTITEVWVDRSEPQPRYYEVTLADGGKVVMLPVPYVAWPNFGLFGLDHVRVKAITAAQFQKVPGIKNPSQITLLEEDKIMAYYGGGHLYATPDRSQPLI
jgi:photosynthetic reaction center H subunit